MWSLESRVRRQVRRHTLTHSVIATEPSLVPAQLYTTSPLDPPNAHS